MIVAINDRKPAMYRTIAIAALATALAGTTAALAADPVTPQEIITKVKQAAAYIATEGEAGLSLFDEADTDFVWKDSYVYVWDCAADKVAAHPVPTSRDLAISSLKDVTGKALGAPMCAAAERSGGGWVEYMWPKPIHKDGVDHLEYTGEPARKVTYMITVDGQPYQVGAGMYDDTLTIEQLDKLVAK